MKHLVALLMIACFMASVAAMAKDNPCKEDKAKFCKDVKAAGGKVADCLREHMNEVSAECKTRLNKPKGAADEKPSQKVLHPMLTPLLHRAKTSSDRHSSIASRPLWRLAWRDARLSSRSDTSTTWLAGPRERRHL
jgi:hypothetical protein